MKDVNIWAERFMCLDKAEIHSASKFIPKKYRGIEHEHVDKACGILEKMLDELFIPTKQTVDIMSSFIGSAIGHNNMVYSNKNNFKKGAYAKDPPLPLFVYPICLTGLAGVGKSSLLNAFKRILPKDEEFYVDQYHSNFKFRSAWFLNVTDKMKLSSMLMSFINAGSDKNNVGEKKRKGKVDIEKLRNSGRHWAYITGVSFLAADELQFIARSQNANALITNIIMMLFSLGLPGVYSVNYSLVHRLLTRPQEDRDRILSNVRVLFPDDPNSTDWIETLKGYKKLLPKCFRFDPIADAVHVYKMTAGIKRNLKKLFLISYRKHRETDNNIYLMDLEWAFNSQEYSIRRDDIKHINEYYITGKCQRKDLMCPVEIPKSQSQLYKDLAQEKSMKSLVANVIAAFMTKEERQVYQKLQKAALGREAEIIQLTTKRAKVINNLRKGDELLQKSLKNKKPKSK